MDIGGKKNGTRGKKRGKGKKGNGSARLGHDCTDYNRNNHHSYWVFQRLRYGAVDRNVNAQTKIGIPLIEGVPIYSIRKLRWIF